MENQACFICSKHRGEIVVAGGCIYEDDLIYVGHIGSNENLVYLGYLIIDLKRHIPGLGDMTEDESKAIGIILNRVSKALKIVENAEHIYCFVQGDAFPHFHVHLIPRYPNTPKEFWSPMNLKNWKDAPHGDAADIVEVCLRLKKCLSDKE